MVPLKDVSAWSESHMELVPMFKIAILTLSCGLILEVTKLCDHLPFRP